MILTHDILEGYQVHVRSIVDPTVHVLCAVQAVL